MMSKKQERVSVVRKTPNLSRTPEQESGRKEAAMPARSPALQVVLRSAQANLNRLQPAELRALQRSVGNRLVQRTRADSAVAMVQRMTIKARDGLNADDYGQAIHNATTQTGYRLFTIWHNTDQRLNIQVHWHPISDGFPQESWTVRWANEGRGNQDALDWMKEKIRATKEGVQVALASMQQGGAEYEAQFPGLGAATGSKKK
jgi:hypothetical protein